MSTQLASLEVEALKLSPEDQVLLADHVLASVRGQNEAEEAWGAEVERRLAEVEAGTVSLSPVEQAVQRAPSAFVKCSLAPGAERDLVEGGLYYSREANADFARVLQHGRPDIVSPTWPTHYQMQVCALGTTTSNKPYASP